MWRFGFFDAVETAPGVYDRVYNAEEFSVPFSALIDTGVLESAGDSLEVTTDGSSMQTTIGTGVAFIRGRYAENTSPRAHTHDTETVGVDRIDRIVVRLDLRPEARYVESFVKKGVASANPVPPALQRDENVYEISLAQVRIRGGQTFISPSDITDERGDEDICPWARSKVLPHIDSEEVVQLRNDFESHVQRQAGVGFPGHAELSITIDDSIDKAATPFIVRQVERRLEASSIEFGDGAQTGPYGYLVAVGAFAEATQQNTVAVGAFSSAEGQGATALGYSADARAQGATALGYDADVTGADAIALGRSAQATGEESIAVGLEAEASGWKSISVGESSQATNTSAIAIGHFARANGITSIALGSNALANGDQSTALGSGASTGVLAENSVAIGYNASAVNDNTGVLGVSTQSAGTNNWVVPGDFSVQGTKNFVIDHPHPDKKDTHDLRHSAVEAPTAGENLYRYEVEAIEDGQTVEVELPDYFQYLNTNVQVFVSPVRHFGRAYGETDGNTLKVTCETAGKYNVMVIGTRNDENVQDWHIMGAVKEKGLTWRGETEAIEVDEILEVLEFKEVDVA